MYGSTMFEQSISSNIDRDVMAQEAGRNNPEAPYRGFPDTMASTMSGTGKTPWPFLNSMHFVCDSIELTYITVPAFPSPKKSTA